MAKKAEFSIVINGIQQSIDAVESLNKQLDQLEQRINNLSKKAINVTTTTSGGGSKGLDAEEKLMRQIVNQEDKLIAARKKEYQILLQQKNEFKEIDNLQKDIVAQERLQADAYANTMNGLKQKLADIKMTMGNLDIGGDAFKNYTKQANEITAKLKQLEQAYGQFGRNVGNYKSAVDGFNKIKVAVGDTVKEYSTYREAVKSLTLERFNLSKTIGTEAEQYKQVDRALKQLQSDYADLNKSSMFMDNLLDTMQGFTAMASIGVGFSRLFDIDDSKFNDTMQKFAALTLAMNGLEQLKKQMVTDEGMGKIFNVAMKPAEWFFKKVRDGWDSLLDKIEEYGIKSSEMFKSLQKRGWEYQGRDKEGKYLLKGQRGGTLSMTKEDFENLARVSGEFEKINLKIFEGHKGFLLLSKTLKGVAIAANIAGKAIKSIFTLGIGMIFIEVLTKVMDVITDFVKSWNTAKIAADRAAESINTLNKQLQIQREILSSDYLRGVISDEEFLNGIYKKETETLEKQIDALRTLSKAREENASGWGHITNLLDATQNTEFTGNRISSGGTTVGRGRLVSWWSGNDLEITVTNMKKLEEEWNKCNEAIKKGNDYYDEFGSTWQQWWHSSFATVKDTEEVMRGLGNVGLSDFIARFDEVNKEFDGTTKGAEKFKVELAKLRNEMNNSEILNSVIANLDKYIPDDKVRTQVQNIINEIYRLDDAFNMTSPEQIHYWNQVRIDAMKDGLAKEKAQIAENERYEIQQKAHTEEQVNLLHAKYARQRKNAEEKAAKDRQSSAKSNGKKLIDIENELIALRIENMKDGLEKELAQIENERRLALQKAKEYGKKSGEIIAQINIKYDKKILDRKRQWAYEVINIYQDMMQRIEQINRATFETEVGTAQQNIGRKESQSLRNTGYQSITPSTYDNTKDLEAYYKKVYEIQKDALDKQTQIQKESLDKQIDYAKREEEMRHQRLIDENGGDYIQQLRAGKITQEQYDELIEKETEAHYAKMNALEKEYASNMEQATEDNLNDTLKLYADYYDKIVSRVSVDKAKIDDLASRSTVSSSTWNMIDIKQTRTNFKIVLSQYDELKNSIIQKQRELEQALHDGKISADDFAIEKKALDDELKGIDDSIQGVREAQKAATEEFMRSINQYVQMVGQSLNEFMSALDSIAEAHYQKEIEALDKQNEILENKLQKQVEITQKYSDKVQDIEDELADSRGDRRQFLIDQLNAQMEAQRESMKQEQEYEKQQEQLAKKREKLEEQERKRKKEAAVRTAIINAILAISAAAVNSYPIPAIPMIAMATAIGAAQVAAAKAAQYAEGGLLQGKSHAQGGIKVLGGTAEVEGNEFITNKKTTMQNLPLLEFINSKKRKIDLSDLIEFYSNGAKKSISSINRNYFADGGQIPTMRTDIDLQSNTIRAMEMYANRPTVVSVIDILDRTKAVNNVRVLSGLADK